MNLEIYTELRNEIEPRLEAVDLVLKSFPRNESGLVEVTEDFRIAKRKFDLVFNELRVLNKHTSNKIKRQYSLKKRFKK